jgi:hypothetical protein
MKSKQFWKELIAYFPLVQGQQRKRLLQFYGCVSIPFHGNVFLSRCLATIEWYTYRHTDWWEGFMNYVVQMGSGATIHINFGSAIQKLIGKHSQTHRQYGDGINLLSFFQNKERRLKLIWISYRLLFRNRGHVQQTEQQPEALQCHLTQSSARELKHKRAIFCYNITVNLIKKSAVVL